MVDVAVMPGVRVVISDMAKVVRQGVGGVRPRGMEALSLTGVDAGCWVPSVV